MNVVIFIVILLITACFAQPQLQQVHVIFRHGDRTPSLASLIRTDPNYKTDFHPIGYGGLTNAGKYRTYKLGKFLRKRYDTFLGDVYFPGLLFARSSDYDRTKMSLQIVLAALFPPTSQQKWHDTLNWQPIPISYVPKEQDDLLGAAHQSVFYAEKDRVIETKDIQSHLEKLKDFMSHLQNVTGREIIKPFDMKRIYDTLHCEQNMNLTLPSWSEGMFPHGKLLEGVLLECDVQTYDANVTYELSGKLIAKITKDMLGIKNKKESSRKDTRLFLYSSHDMTVNGILRSLKVYGTHVPYFSSAAIIELLKENDSHYVKVLYYHGNSSNVQVLKMPGCSELCPMDKYLANVNDLLILDNSHVQSID